MTQKNHPLWCFPALLTFQLKIEGKSGIVLLGLFQENGKKIEKNLDDMLMWKMTKMCALTNQSGMDAIYSCDYVTCVIVI